MSLAPRPRILLVVPLLLSLTTASDAISQALVMGQVVDGATAEPLRGVFVTVWDTAGNQVRGVLTDEGGRFQLQAPLPGTYSLQADRIGFDPVMSPPLELGPTPLSYHFELTSRPIVLTGVVADVDQRQCRVRPEEGSRLQAIWEQVRMALDVAAWTERTGYLAAEQRTYERWIEPGSGRVRQEIVHDQPAFGTVGFATPAPEEVIAGGFVQRAGDDYVFYGLDAATILSDAFLDTHCFRLRAPSGRPDGQLGLAFEPVRGRRLPDVRGVLWLDEESAELRNLEYVYTWLPWTVPPETFGGEASFRRLPSGAWIVEQWALQMPQVEREPRDFSRSRLPPWVIIESLRREAGLQIKEVGGEVMALYTADGVRLPGPDWAALAGVVHDSIGGHPLVGARVGIVGTDYHAISDENGRYRLADLPAGVYGVAFEHPALEEWEIELPAWEVELRRGEATVRDMAVPSLATVLAAGCRFDRADGEDGGPPGARTLVGRVVTTDTREPVGGAAVLLRVEGPTAEETLTAWTDTAGVYRFCHVPGHGPGRLSTSFVGQAGTELALELPATGPAFHELSLALDAPSRVTGRVLDVDTGRPVRGATVRLDGIPGERVSDEGGRFRFQGVGRGRHGLEVAHLAYGVARDSLRVDGTGRALEVEVRLAGGAIPLEPIVVTVESRPISGTLRTVYDRIDRVRRMGGGTVFDRADIERRNPTQLTRLLDEVRGFNVEMRWLTPVITSTRAVSGLGTCVTTVWIDGIKVISGGGTGDVDLNINGVVMVSNIEAVEVYHASGRIPGEFSGSDAGCGVVLIWTRRGP
jgi:hypothetical protein